MYLEPHQGGDWGSGEEEDQELIEASNYSEAAHEDTRPVSAWLSHPPASRDAAEASALSQHPAEIRPESQ